MAESDDAFAESFGKLVLGAGFGFGLYLLVTGLGFGFGRRDGESAPPLPHDRVRLTFTMFEGDPVVFRISGSGPSSLPYSVDELIARVRAGGRSDVNLHIRGTVIQHAADEALARLKAAGIEVFRAMSPGVR